MLEDNNFLRDYWFCAVYCGMTCNCVHNAMAYDNICGMVLTTLIYTQSNRALYLCLIPTHTANKNQIDNRKKP
jgi:hypothetical protein